MNATVDPRTAITANTPAQGITPGSIRVIKRNGSVMSFDAEKISVAISKAFLAVEGTAASGSSRIHERVQQLTEMVLGTFKRRLPSGGTVHIEEIQDQVELALIEFEAREAGHVGGMNKYHRPPGLCHEITERVSIEQCFVQQFRKNMRAAEEG